MPGCSQPLRSLSPGIAALLLLALVLGGLGLTAPLEARAATAEERALAEAKSRLAQVREDVERASSEADGADAALADADEMLAEIEQVVNEIAGAVERQRSATAQSQQRLERLEGERDAVVDAFNRRASRMYKLGPTTALDLLLTGDDAADALAKSSYVQQLLKGDQVDLETVAAAQVAVEAEGVRAQTEQDRLASLLAEQEVVLGDVEQLRQSRALAAATARDEVRLLLEQQDDLEGEQARLEQVIADRQAEQRRREIAQREAAQRAAAQRTAAATPSAPAPSSPPAAAPNVPSGGYTWPLCGPVTSEYGPRWGRTHRGIDLGVPTGTPIGAARGGTVIFANWQGGYGRLVLVDHHDGVVTAYAHMSAFSVSAGQSVERGQKLGAVGSTGNSTGPHLHLEFRVGGSAVNPRQYLSGSPC